MRRQADAGFTIIELLVATSVFSVVLLVGSAAIIGVGRLYYKGVTEARTQETSRAIIDSIGQAIQYSPVKPIFGTSMQNGSNSAVCLNGLRYSYVIGRQVSGGAHGLVLDSITADCTAVRAQDLSAALTSSSQEMLAANMRLATLNVTDLGSDLYRVTVRVVYGDDDVLNAAKNDCNNSIRSGTQFCAMSELTMVIKRRL